MILQLLFFLIGTHTTNGVMSEPPARLHEQFQDNNRADSPSSHDHHVPTMTTSTPTAVPRGGRNLADLAKAGKVLEIGRPNIIGTTQNSQSSNSQKDDNAADDSSIVGIPATWSPPPSDSFDPELTEYNDYAPINTGCASDKHSCNSCLDVGSGDMHAAPGRSFCVWCASSGTCLERSHAFDLNRRAGIEKGNPPTPGTCRAGIATNPRHCGEVVDKIQKHFESQDDPLQLAAEEELAKEMHFTVKVGWPKQGTWVGHVEPSDIGLDGFFRAEEGKPTLVDICYSLFGPSSSGKPLIKRCKSIRNPVLGDLHFPEPGPYTLSAWALDNVDDRFLSPMVTIAFDRLPSELFEEGLFSTDPHAPGFPNTLEDSGLSTLILATNRKLFGAGRLGGGGGGGGGTVKVAESDDDHDNENDGENDGNGNSNSNSNENVDYEASDTPLLYRPTGFEAGGGLQTTTTRMIHTMWWDGMGDMQATATAAARHQHGLDQKLQHLSSWSHSWTKYHSSQRWTYRVWDYVSMEKLFDNEFSGAFRGLYSRMKSKVDKMQLTKYMVLLHHGGVVVSPTMECLKPFDALVIQTGVVLSYEMHNGVSKISTDMISSPPWHPLWWFVLHEIKRRVNVMERANIKAMQQQGELGETAQAGEEEKKENSTFVDLTGVDMLTHAVKLYQELYPDTALKILNEPEDLQYGGKRVVAMVGDDKNDGCTLRGDCSLKYKQEYAVKHYVESIESEQRLASTGSTDVPTKNDVKKAKRKTDL